MVRRALSFTVASALFCGGLWANYFLFFQAAQIPPRFLGGAELLLGIGIYWLWVDFIAPWLGIKARE
jgi:hypothetical protein